MSKPAWGTGKSGGLESAWKVLGESALFTGERVHQRLDEKLAEHGKSFTEACMRLKRAASFFPPPAEAHPRG